MNLLNNYITLCILLQLLVEVNSQITSLDLRYAHTATLIDDKLYILGGGIPPRTNNLLPPKESFLYLNISAPFDTSEVKYIDISNNNIVPSHRHSIAVKGGANNRTLFLYGGEGKAMELVYTFDAQHNTWSVPKITGAPPIGKAYMFPIIDHNGLMYLFGGNTLSTSGYVNDMFILDTINLSWKQASSINAPSNRDNYAAAFLPNKNILYIGT
jgi:hypothetical protein